MNYTVLDVNEGTEKREADAYISAYAKGGEAVGEFQSQSQALRRLSNSVLRVEFEFEPLALLGIRGVRMRNHNRIALEERGAGQSDSRSCAL